MEYLVRVGVANPTEHMWIGECSLQRVIFRQQLLAECLVGGLEDLQATRIMLCKLLAAPKHIERGPALGTRLGQRERPGVKHEVSQRGPAGLACAGGKPAQSAGDHQMQQQPQVAFESYRDPLADAP